MKKIFSYVFLASFLLAACRPTQASPTPTAAPTLIPTVAPTQTPTPNVCEPGNPPIPDPMIIGGTLEHNWTTWTYGNAIIYTPETGGPTFRYVWKKESDQVLTLKDDELFEMTIIPVDTVGYMNPFYVQQDAFVMFGPIIIAHCGLNDWRYSDQYKDRKIEIPIPSPDSVG